MKILQLSPRYRGGGAERCARELFHALEERGHDVSMWTAIPENDTPEGVVCIRTMAERLLSPASFFDPICDWRHFGSRQKLDAIQPGDFDLVHLHNIHSNWVAIKALYRLCKRVPVIWTLHDEWAATNGIPYNLSRLSELKPKLKYLQQQSPRLPLSSDHPTAIARNRFLSEWIPIPKTLISPSRYLMELTKKNTQFQKTSIQRIPYGLKFAENSACTVDRQVARKKWGLDVGAHVALIVSAQLDSPYKGTWFAIEALNEIANKSPEMPLSVLMLGKQSDELSMRFNANIDVRSDYANSDEELCHAYRASDLTLIPSTADNFPYVALESFSCETPVVCFSVGGMPELVGESERGISMPPFEVQTMSESIISLFESEKQRSTLGKNARDWVCSHCQFEGYVDQIVQEYKNAIDQFEV